jgi:hypothetical protein
VLAVIVIAVVLVPPIAVALRRTRGWWVPAAALLALGVTLAVAIPPEETSQCHDVCGAAWGNAFRLIALALCFGLGTGALLLGVILRASARARAPYDS